MANLLSAADGAIISAAEATARAREEYTTHAAQVANAMDDLRSTFQGDEANGVYQVGDY